MRIVLGWVGAAVLLLGAIVGGVVAANATAFSASGFVRDYLDALADGRVDEVLALPGVDSAGLDARLLDPLALTAVDATVVDDTERGGVHRITVAFSASGESARATLQVERIGTRFGLFPEWGFAVSPITALSVATTGDGRLTVGRLPLDLGSGAPTVFAALTPGVYTLTHRSEFLTATPVTIAASGGEASVQLDIGPNAAFVAAAQSAMEAQLTSCTTQQVLFPTGCPFGFAIENRVVSAPRWTISQMPDATIAASDKLGLWAVPPADGVAHLSVEVQSLFDGSVTTLEKDVPFSAGYRIAFDGSTVVLDPALR
ncbi:MAG: hypothetical protein DI534_09695 [Leifsonia xyli]|nr:MAG: hypothetical protein DI534_09695 [Leifsonia xyli]